MSVNAIQSLSYLSSWYSHIIACTSKRSTWLDGYLYQMWPLVFHVYAFRCQKSPELKYACCAWCVRNEQLTNRAGICTSASRKWRRKLLCFPREIRCSSPGSTIHHCHARSNAVCRPISKRLFMWHPVARQLVGGGDHWTFSNRK